MRKLKIAALAGASLLAMTSYASADPVSIGFFLFAGPLGSVFSFGALVTAAQIGLYAAGAAASFFAGRQRGKIDPGEYKQTFETEASSEIRAVGRVRVGGLEFYGNTSGFSGFRAIAHCRGPIDLVEEHFLGGRLVVVEANGNVSTPPWGAAPSVKPDGSWAKVYAKVGDGTETSWTQLQTYFPELWTPDHRARGIAQSLVQFDSPGLALSEQFGKLYQGGYPEYERTQRSELIYDPRLDSTNGGSGTQRADDESTWTWSDNGILCAAHILRSYPDLTSGDFDWSDIALEATKADTLVDTLTGTEKRARCWGFWQSESNRGDVMEQVLDSIGAEIQMSDEGKVQIRLIDDERTSDLTFTDDHIVEYTLKSGPDAAERPNVCRVSYYSPERNYTMADIDLTDIAWARIDDEVTRYGEKFLDIELPFCPSASQAQRIARRLFALARADRGSVTTNMAGLAAWDRNVVNIEFSDFDTTETCLIDPPRIDDATGTIEIPFAVQPVLATWDPDTMEAPAPEEIPDIEYESEVEKPDAPTLATLVQYPDASYEVRVAYTVPTGATQMTAIHRIYTGGLPGAWQSMTVYDPPSTVIYAYDDVAGGGLETDFRVQAYNAEGDSSYPSDVFNTTPAISNTAPVLVTDDIVSDYANYEGIGTTSINASYATLQRRDNTSGSYGPYTVVDTVNIRPNELVDLADPSPLPEPTGSDKVEYSIRVHSSNGTASTALVFEYTDTGA